ncbi:MAG: monovalent cation/H(+) antiporter subunit G [Pseudomonadota bacterium]|nr:monovalent cation/H(+) antiporter subunit G [Pseudomonadota bacterium]
MSALFALLAAVLIAVGGVLLVAAALGVTTLPDALSRQHAATKAVTLALMSICVGAFLVHAGWSWGWRLGLIVAYLMITLPVASHLLARAAVMEGDAVAEGTPVVDRCDDQA